MTLRDVVEKRYQEFISIADVIQQISEQYECSESDARHVLARALQKSVMQPELYSRRRLGPELQQFEQQEVLNNLNNPERDPAKELDSGIPF